MKKANKVEHVCQLPSCGKVNFFPKCIARKRKYCSSECAHIHQKELGIRKNNKNNSLETLIRIYGEEEGINRHEAFRKRISDFVKENPIKNQNGFRSEEMRKKISLGRKEFNNKRKLELNGINVDHDNIKKLEYDQRYGEGKYDSLKKRMKGVFSLEWFIKKYGEIDGSQKYHERCENIKKTTHFKTYNLTNNSNISKISQKLFDMLYDDDELNLKDERVYYHNLNHEHACYTGRNFDFVVLNRKKIIEFNGDKFHANPTIYTEEDTPNPFLPQLKAAQIWEDDYNKIKLATDKGFSVLVIWESEFKNNEINTINKCKQFLKN